MIMMMMMMMVIVHMVGSPKLTNEGKGETLFRYFHS